MRYISSLTVALFLTAMLQFGICKYASASGEGTATIDPSAFKSEPKEDKSESKELTPEQMEELVHNTSLAAEILEKAFGLETLSVVVVAIGLEPLSLGALTIYFDVKTIAEDPNMALESLVVAQLAVFSPGLIAQAIAKEIGQTISPIAPVHGNSLPMPASPAISLPAASPPSIAPGFSPPPPSVVPGFAPIPGAVGPLR